MQIEVYSMTAESDNVTIQLEAVCDSFSSLLWDMQFYDCGAFEVYIAANSRNLDIFRIGKIVGRDDDKEHFGIIESVDLKTDAEKGEGADRKNTSYFIGDEPAYLDRYEIFVDAKDLADEEQSDSGETIPIPDAEYTEMLREKGAENLVPIIETSESTIATDGRQYQYNKDYFIGDYVTVLHERFGLKQAKIQLVGMIESFDQNGYSLTPTFKEV